MSTSSNTRRVLRIGIFFDGTANNQFNSQSGLERQARGQVIDADSSYAKVPTNIARLHQRYPVQSTFDANGMAITSLYISGIGTTTGAGDTRFPAQTYGRGSTGVLGKAVQARTQLAECLEHFVQQLPEHTLSDVQLDLFGFSRGAAAARHFANLVNATRFEDRHKLAPGFECTIHFIGLFDTVAAMGGLTDLGDVSDAINPGLNLYLGPESAQQVVQLSARDEQRRNFSLSRIAPQWPMDIAVPGAHADVGGGYPLQMSEQVYVTRWETSLVAPSTPSELTHAWKTAAAQLKAWQARDLLDPLDPERLLEVRSHAVQEGSRKDPMKRVQAAVFMQRRLYGHLSRVYLRLMHRLACENGVPLQPLTDAQSSLPDELLALESRLEARLAKGETPTFTQAQERVLRQRYVHLSANWNAAIGEGTGVLDKVFFDIPQEGGRSVFEQKAPGFA